ncbi:MAG: prohibitin family protein [Candidatus Uhrbacteria bacterium]
MADAIDTMMYTFVVEDVLKGFFVNVPPGYVACVYDLGRGVLKKVLTPGLHFKIPFWQRAKLFNTQTLEYTISKKFNLEHAAAMGDQPVGAVTSDNVGIKIEGTVLLRLDQQQIPTIWQSIGEDFVEKIIRPTIRSRFRMIASRYSFSDIVSTRRDAIELDMREEFARIFLPRGIVVENVLLSEITKNNGGGE